MPRTGSTSLYHYLRRHPGIALPFRKETHFFSFCYDRGRDWYTDLFERTAAASTGFDVGPDYFYDARSVSRIQESVPEGRVVLCLRDPVAWSLSLYGHLARSDRRIPPYERFIERYTLRVGGTELSLELCAGLISERVEVFRQTFGERLLVYDYAYFESEPLAVLQAIEGFAGLPVYFSESSFSKVRLNVSRRRAGMLARFVLGNERFVLALRRALPDRWLGRAREWYYLAEARFAGRRQVVRHTSRDLRTAQEAFGAERRFVESLFAAGPIVLGTGEPFANSDSITR